MKSFPKIKYIVIPYLILTVLHIIMAIPLSVPVVWPDEYIFIFFSQFIAGTATLPDLQNSNTIGSYGYSILIAPLSLLFKDPSSLYRAIIVLNSIIGSSLYIALFLFLSKILKAESGESAVIAFVSCLYPAFIIQTNVAYTSGITPAIFTFTVLSFYNLLKNKTLLSSIIFSLMCGLLSIIHVRFIPVIITSLVLVGYLIYLKKLQFVHLLAIIFILSLFSVFHFEFDKIIFTGFENINAKVLLTAQLIEIFEVTILIFYVYLTIFFIIKQHYLYLISSICGIITGLFFSTQEFSSLLLLVLVSYLILLKIKDRVTVKEIFKNLAVFILLFLITAFVFSNPDHAGTISYRITNWLINSLGTIYYGAFATHLLLLIGFALLFLELTESGLITRSTPISEDGYISETTTRFYIRKLLNEPEKAALFFYVITSIFLFLITKTTFEYSSDFYRADLLFFGRYIEAFFPPLIAYSFFKLKTINLKKFFFAATLSMLIFILITYILILKYGNMIYSEIDFRSCISFFSLRAPLGNINIILYSLFALVISNIILLLIRFKAYLAIFFSGVVFLAFSAFTYYYVIIYHQNEKLSRTRILDLLEELPDSVNIYYDNSLINEFSNNAFGYMFQMPGRKFSLINTDKSIIKKAVIFGGKYDYMDSYSSNAILLQIEQSGEDYLWLNPDFPSKINYKKFMPSYSDVPLLKDYIGGVSRKRFTGNYNISEHSFIRLPWKESDSNIVLNFAVYNAYGSSHFMEVKVNGKSVFHDNIRIDSSQYKIYTTIQPGISHIKIEFIDSLAKYDPTTKIQRGIFLIDFNIANLSENYLLNNNEQISENLIEDAAKNIKLKIRGNYDLSKMPMTPNGEIKIPIVIENIGTKNIYFNGKYPVYLTYSWLSFVFQNTESVCEIPISLSGLLKPGEETNAFIKVKNPKNKGKYFLKFDLIQKGQGLLDKGNSISQPILFKI